METLILKNINDLEASVVAYESPKVEILEVPVAIGISGTRT